MIPVRFRIPALAVLAAVLAAGQVRAIEEPPRPPVSALSKIRDLAATVRARRALAADPALRRLNLGVEVENGVATLWGPIPSANVARLAVSRMQNVQGIVEVKHNFYIEQRDNSHDLQLVRPLDAPLRIDVAKPDSDTGTLPPPPRLTEAALAGPLAARPIVTTPVVGPRPSSSPRLHAPRPLVERAGEARASDPPARQTLAQQIAEVQQSDVRFRSIRVRVEDRTVVILRGSNDADRVMALFRRLRELRDVREVLLTDE